MTYDLAPAHADTDAPLPSGIAYEETTEPHEGCPRGGFLAWRIDDFTGAGVSCCTRCGFRRAYVMTTATAEALRLQAEAEAAASHPNARPHEDGTGRFVATLAPRPARLCGCGCGRQLLRRQHWFASVACRRRAADAQRVAVEPAAPPPRFRDAVCVDCGDPFQQCNIVHASPRCGPCRKAVKVRRAVAWKREHRPAPVLRTAPCVDCGTTVELRQRARTDTPARCAPCFRLHLRARERALYRLRRERAEQAGAAQREAA